MITSSQPQTQSPAPLSSQRRAPLERCREVEKIVCEKKFQSLTIVCVRAILLNTKTFHISLSVQAVSTAAAKQAGGIFAFFRQTQQTIQCSHAQYIPTIHSVI